MDDRIDQVPQSTDRQWYWFLRGIADGGLTLSASLPAKGTNLNSRSGRNAIATLAFSNYNPFGTTLSSMSAVTVNSGGTIFSSGTVTVFDNLTLNNATISVNGGDTHGALWGSFGFGGTTTATGTSAIDAISGAAGTISIGNAFSPTFTINTPALTDSLAISVEMQSTLAVVKQGVGTVTLSAANIYTGTTTISGGTLIAAKASALGTGTGAVSVASGAGLDYVAGADAQLAIGGTLSITSGSGTVIGGSIGSTTTSADIHVAGIASTTSGAVVVNIYGAPSVNALSGTNTYTLVNGASGSTLNNATYTLGKIYDNSSFTVGTSSLASTATTLQVSITGATPLANAYWTGGLSGANNVWAESDGTANSNWAATLGGPVQALVPGSTTSVTISSSAINTAPTATVLGANMTINNLTIADTVNGLGLTADGNALTITPTSASTGITMNAGVPASVIGANVVLGAARRGRTTAGAA